MKNRDRKLRLLYDGTILADGLGKGSNRSGIFMVVYHIFVELLKSPQLELWLYSAPERLAEMEAFLYHFLPAYHHRIHIINDPAYYPEGLPLLDRLLLKTRAFKDRLCSQHKCLRCQAVRGGLLFLKVLRKVRNYFIPSKKKILSGDIKSQLSLFDAVLSPAFPHLPEVLENHKIKRYTILYDTIPFIFPDLFPDTVCGYSWGLELLQTLNADDICFAISLQTKKDYLYFSKLYREYDSDLLKMFCSRVNCNPYTSQVVTALQRRKQNGLLPPNPQDSALQEFNIEVMLLAADKRFHPEESINRKKQIFSKYNLPAKGKYIFSLCTLEKRKNIIYSIRNFLEFIEKNHIDDLYFVLGGGFWNTYRKELDSILGQAEKADRILRIGYVDDEDVNVLYSNALCMVYPSLYEGFGLPVLEAMQCGCPVIASNNSSIPEVAGDACILIDITRDEPLQEALKKVYSDSELRKSLAAKGLAQAKRFSWNKAGKIIVSRILKDFNSGKQ